MFDRPPFLEKELYLNGSYSGAISSHSIFFEVRKNQKNSMQARERGETRQARSPARNKISRSGARLVSGLHRIERVLHRQQTAARVTAHEERFFPARRISTPPGKRDAPPPSSLPTWFSAARRESFRDPAFAERTPHSLAARRVRRRHASYTDCRQSMNSGRTEPFGCGGMEMKTAVPVMRWFFWILQRAGGRND